MLCIHFGCKPDVIIEKMVTYETNISKYVTFSVLGQGYCGAAVVYLAKHNPSSTMVAIKKINMDRAKEEASLVQVSI